MPLLKISNSCAHRFLHDQAPAYFSDSLPTTLPDHSFSPYSFLAVSRTQTFTFSVLSVWVFPQPAACLIPSPQSGFYQMPSPQSTLLL